jgi:hypothetical protein
MHIVWDDQPNRRSNEFIDELVEAKTPAIARRNITDVANQLGVLWGPFIIRILLDADRDRAASRNDVSFAPSQAACWAIQAIFATWASAEQWTMPVHNARRSEKPDEQLHKRWDAALDLDFEDHESVFDVDEDSPEHVVDLAIAFVRHFKKGALIPEVWTTHPRIALEMCESGRGCPWTLSNESSPVQRFACEAISNARRDADERIYERSRVVRDSCGEA